MSNRQPPPVRGVQASGRVILLRLGALVGCILGASLARRRIEQAAKKLGIKLPERKETA